MQTQIKYYKELLELNNGGPGVGVVTLWTNKESVMPYIKKENYSILGQLYSKQKGVSVLLRHLLLNKHIRHLIIVGKDFGGAGDALTNLFKYGVDNENRIVSCENASLDNGLPKEKIDLIRTNVKLHDLRGVPLSEINQYIEKNILHENVSCYGASEEFPEEEVMHRTLPSEVSGFKIYGRYVGEIWLKLLNHILKYGTLKKSEYSDNQKEILNLMAVIQDENPSNFKWETFFNFTKEDLEKYLPQVLGKQSIEGIEYTYGVRLFDHKGINQIQTLIQKLRLNLFSRRAIAVTWNVQMDGMAEKPPCLILIQCVVQNKLLHITSYFRSNDIYNAWPRNAFALRKLQQAIATNLNLELGSLTTISNSAHVYEKDIVMAEEILKNNKKHYFIEDPRGRFVIELAREKNKIKLIHESSAGTPLNVYYGQTAEELIGLIKDDVSLIEHAFYLGNELKKAEIALILRIDFKQDCPLYLFNSTGGLKQDPFNLPFKND